MRWLDSITDLMHMSLSKLREVWRPEEPGVLQSISLQRVGHDLGTEQQQQSSSKSSEQSEQMMKKRIKRNYIVMCERQTAEREPHRNLVSDLRPKLISRLCWQLTSWFSFCVSNPGAVCQWC